MPTVPVNIHMQPEKRDRIDELAARFGLTRSQVVNHLIDRGLDYVGVWGLPFAQQDTPKGDPS